MADVRLRSSLRNDLSADPQDVVEVLMAVQAEFGTEWSDSLIQRLDTVGQIARQVDSRVEL